MHRGNTIVAAHASFFRWSLFAFALHNEKFPCEIQRKFYILTKLDHFTTKGGWNDLAQILKQLCSSSLTLREIDYHMLIQCLSRTTQQFLLFVSVLMQEFRLETTSVRNRCWMHSGIQEHHEGDAVDSFVEIILELHLLPFFHFKVKRWSISDDSDYFLKFLFPRSN